MCIEPWSSLTCYCCCSFAAAIWPVWGLLVLLIMPCLFMGCLILLTLIPI